MTDSYEIRDDAESDFDLVKVRRLFWATVLVPVVVIIALGFISYNMAVRINELEQVTDELDAVTNEVNTIQKFLITERYLERSSNFEWAILTYEEMIKEHEHPLILNRLGGIYASIQRYEKAKAVLEKAIEVESDNWQAYSTLAYVFFREHNYMKSIEAGERSLAINSLNADAYNTLAWIYATAESSEITDLKKALKYAKKAAEITHHSNPQIMDTLSTVYFEMGQYREALKGIQIAIEITNNNSSYITKRKKIEKQLK